MLDYKELGFDSEEDMFEYMESERDSHLDVWNQLKKWEVK